MRAFVPIGLTVLVLGLGRAEPSPGNPDPDGKVTGATVLAFVDTPHPPTPRRRALRGPLFALAGAIA